MPSRPEVLSVALVTTMAPLALVLAPSPVQAAISDCASAPDTSITNPLDVAEAAGEGTSADPYVVELAAGTYQVASEVRIPKYVVLKATGATVVSTHANQSVVRLVDGDATICGGVWDGAGITPNGIMTSGPRAVLYQVQQVGAQYGILPVANGYPTADITATETSSTGNAVNSFYASGAANSMVLNAPAATAADNGIVAFTGATITVNGGKSTNSGTGASAGGGAHLYLNDFEVVGANGDMTGSGVSAWNNGHVVATNLYVHDSANTNGMIIGRGGTADITNGRFLRNKVSSDGHGGQGIEINISGGARPKLTLRGTTVFENNAADGLYGRGADITVTGRVTSTGNRIGVFADAGTVFTASAPVTTSSNRMHGVSVAGSAAFTELVSNYNALSGLKIYANRTASVSTCFTALGNKGTWMPTVWLDPGATFTGATTTRCSMRQIRLGPDTDDDGRGEVYAVAPAGGLSGYPVNADGTLGTPTSMGSGFVTQQVFAPGDLDHDGEVDIVTIASDGRLLLYGGAGGFELKPPKQIGSGWKTWRLVPAGDMTSDDNVDLFGIDGSGRLWLFRGKSDSSGTFLPKVQVGSGWGTWKLFAGGDLNADGANDILGVDPSGVLWKFLGKGDGYFLPKQKGGSGWNTFQLASGADLTGDGVADLMGRDNRNGDLYFYKGTGGGNFAAKVKVASGW